MECFEPSVRYNNNLTWFEKVLFSEITALTNVSGFCFAKNSYFEFVFNVSISTIQRALKKLESENLIKVDILRSENNEVEQRKIYIMIDNTPPLKNDGTPPLKNDGTPPLKNDGYNNTRKSNKTRYNYIDNNNKNKSFQKPQRPDVNPDWLDEYLKENT